MIAQIACLPEHISSEEQQMPIERRKDHRLRAQHPEILRLHRHRQNVLRLTGPAIEPRQLPAVNDVRIDRIGDDITIFLGRDRLPIPKRDLAFVAAAFDTDRAAFLLPAVKPIRKRVVGTDMIQLCRRLVVPRAPGHTAIDRDDRSLVRAEQNNVGIVRINPNILIIIAAGSPAPSLPGLAAVGRFPANHARRVNDLWIFRIEPNYRQIAATDTKARARVVGRAVPDFAAVLRAIKFRDRFRPDCGEKCFRRAWRNTEVRLHNVGWQPLC